MKQVYMCDKCSEIWMHEEDCLACENSHKEPDKVEYFFDRAKQEYPTSVRFHYSNVIKDYRLA